ncbi:MAG: hypothetical protein WB384_24325 [Candidatus Sulfotelmatobacter sp.]
MTRQCCDKSRENRAQVRRRLLNLCLWAMFASGVAIEVLTPGLKIENHAFVMPASVTRSGAQIRPDALVNRERRMQWAAASLTIGGAIALAFCYRRTLAHALLGREQHQHGPLGSPPQTA